jgi:hypothetical protein
MLQYIVLLFISQGSFPSNLADHTTLVICNNILVRKDPFLGVFFFVIISSFEESGCVIGLDRRVMWTFYGVDWFHLAQDSVIGGLL